MTDLRAGVVPQGGPLMRRSVSRLAFLAAAAGGLSACASFDLRAHAPAARARTPVTSELEALPHPRSQFTVAVYGFRDLTGQRRQSENIADLSTAVTQGGASILTDALLRTGRGRWFRVVEREGLQNLLQERQLIRATRAEYQDTSRITPLVFAGAILEGGIVSYDTNTVTGGAGVRFFGIGAFSDIRMDEVMVNLRLVSVQTGQIMRSVTVKKSVLSARTQGNFYRFVSDNKVLEVEAGLSRNEPAQFAVRQAIEKAVYSLVMEGADVGLWSFADAERGRELLERYRADGAATEPHSPPPTASS